MNWVTFNSFSTFLETVSLQPGNDGYSGANAALLTRVRGPSMFNKIDHPYNARNAEGSTYLQIRDKETTV